MKPLNQFYAVTLTSLYKVVAKDGSGRPFAEKLARRGESDLPVGKRLRSVACILISDHLALSEGKTSDLVALFTNQKEARRCHREKRLKPFDRRWKKETQAVFNRIGDNHPSFAVQK